jgi:hypothetical protein
MAAPLAGERWQRDVFVLGAGFSRAASRHLPLNDEALFDLIVETLKGTGGQVVDDDESLKAFDRFGRNIETWLTWLGSDHPWLGDPGLSRRRAGFGEVAQALALAILRSQNDAFGEATKTWLTNVIHAWNNRAKNVTVVTLNYDSLVEKRFEDMTHTTGALVYSFMPQLIGGGARWSGPQETFRLLKLHGSITWYIYPPAGTADSLYGPIFDAGLAMGWNRDNEDEVASRVGARTPLIVPPVLSKDPYFSRPELREQWFLADDALHYAERLFIVGYSLPEADLAMRFLLDRIHPDCAVSVVDRGTSVAPRAKNWLKPRKVDDTFTGRDTVVEEFVTSYVVMTDGVAT